MVTGEGEENFKLMPEKLEITLTPELVERMDEVVELLDLGSKEELVRCAVRRYVDRYCIISKRTGGAG